MNKKYPVIAGALVTIGIIAGGLWLLAQPDEPLVSNSDTTFSTKRCGDGICSAKEKADLSLCPEDCRDDMNPTTDTKATTPKIGKCGDGICNEVEKNNPNLCPEDCADIFKKSDVSDPVVLADDPVFIEKGEANNIPYYFVAIHNEPWHEPSHTNGGEERIAEEYIVLGEIVNKADQYDIKLTLMFSAQWSDYIVDSGKLDEITKWENNGHEIAIHHHSVNHGNWDGYTDFPEEVAIRKRINKKGPNNYESYLGTLNDFIDGLKRLNPNVNSGCSNAENIKFSIPDEIIYETCSGFANFGDSEKLSDIDPEKGRNDYVLSFSINNIKRYFLTHYKLYKDVELARNVFNTLGGNQAYGIVVHSFEDEAENLYEFMEFLHEKDSTAQRSKTVSEIIEQQLLPKKEATI